MLDRADVVYGMVFRHKRWLTDQSFTLDLRPFPAFISVAHLLRFLLLILA